MVMEVVHEDIGDGNLQCTNHPYKTTDAPGGICALCLQEKLGKLVSSSFPMTVFPSSSSSPSPSFRSDFDAAAGGGPSRPHFAPTNKTSNDFVFKRSKSTAGPRRRRNRGMNFLDESFDDKYNNGSPHKKGFWSFLYASKRNNKKLGEKGFSKDSSFSSTVGGGSVSSASGVAGPWRSSDKVDENGNGNGNGNESPVLDRKVSRSRSVGCGGSRSFSGDFFERISTGFGDCTLRRVESHREGKSKVGQQSSPSVHRQQQEDCMIKERVRCGGIFSGFMITTSSSSSSSSLISEETNKNNYNGNNNVCINRKSSINNSNLCHLRSKSWGWALASPMRAFSNKQSGRRGAAKHATPNLSAIPSLLVVSS